MVTLHKLTSLQLQCVEATVSDMAALTGLQRLELFQVCSLRELLLILDGHRDLKRVVYVRQDWPEMTIRSSESVMPSAVTLPNLHTLSLLDFDTMEVFDIITRLVLPPKASVRVGCLLAHPREATIPTYMATIPTYMAPVQSYLASKLGEPSMPRMIGISFEYGSITFQLPNITLTIECETTGFKAHCEAVQELILTLIPTVIGTIPVRVTVKDPMYSIPSIISPFERNIRELVVTSYMEWTDGSMAEVVRSCPELRSFESPISRDAELFVNCIERKSRGLHWGLIRSEPKPLESIHLHGWDDLDPWFFARLRAVVDEVSWTHVPMPEDPWLQADIDDAFRRRYIE